MKIGIIGTGVMGEIISGALVEKSIVEKSKLMISDVDIKKLRRLKRFFKIETTLDNNKIINFSDLIVLCVKPQNSKKLLLSLQNKLKEHQFVISIMAGVKLSTLKKYLNHEKIIRSMPNLTAKIGEGMTVWMATKKIENFQKMIAKMIFHSFGKEIEVHSEDLIDAATAVSGTGPAYIYYIAENLMKEAMSLGFGDKNVHKLVQQTFKGAMDLWADTNEKPDVLRHKVTSKSGTTEAAIKFYNKNKLDNIKFWYVNILNI